MPKVVKLSERQLVQFSHAKQRADAAVAQAQQAAAVAQDEQHRLNGLLDLIFDAHGITLPEGVEFNFDPEQGAFLLPDEEKGGETPARGGKGRGTRKAGS